MADARKGFWSSLPGVLTGVAAVLTAATGLYVAISDRPGSDAIEADTPLVAPVANSAAEPAAMPAMPAPAAPPGPADVFTLAAVIDDPDGYTNVRSLRSASSQIVARVERGEPFHTYRQDGNWWQVRTRDGKVGYMHVSRIRLLEDR